MQIIFLAVAAGRALGLVRLWPQIHTLSLLARPQIPGARLVEREFLCDGSKQLADVFARLCRGLEEE
jgi:hypothetical protein